MAAESLRKDPDIAGTRPMSRPFEIKEIENVGRKSVIGVVVALARRPCIG